MSDDYYKARISELERELEAAHAELGQYGADIKMLEAREQNIEEDLDQQMLWELYSGAMIKLIAEVSPSPRAVLENVEKTLEVWKERK